MTNLERLRLKAGLSCEELAELAEVSRNTVLAAERGETRPRPKSLWKIARALEARPDVEGTVEPATLLLPFTQPAAEAAA